MLLGLQKVLEGVFRWANECNDFLLLVLDTRLYVQWENDKKIKYLEKMAFLLLLHCVSLSPSPSLCMCVHVHVQVPVCVNNTIEKDNSPSNVDSLNVIPMKSCLASYSLPDSNPSLSANVLSILSFSANPPQHVRFCLRHISSLRLHMEAKFLLSHSSVEVIVPPLIQHWR